MDSALGVSYWSVAEHAEVCDIAQMVLLAAMKQLAIPDFSLKALQMISGDFRYGGWYASYSPGHGSAYFLFMF